MLSEKITSFCGMMTTKKRFGNLLCISVFLDFNHLVAEWLACWTQAQKGLGSNRSRDAAG